METNQGMGATSAEGCLPPTLTQCGPVSSPGADPAKRAWTLIKQAQGEGGGGGRSEESMHGTSEYRRRIPVSNLGTMQTCTQTLCPGADPQLLIMGPRVSSLKQAQGLGRVGVTSAEGSLPPTLTQCGQHWRMEVCAQVLIQYWSGGPDFGRSGGPDVETNQGVGGVHRQRCRGEDPQC